MKKLLIISLVLAGFSTACNTVTIVKHGNAATEEEPTEVKNQNYFWWGLAGKGDLYVDQVCGKGQSASQIKNQFTAGDVVLNIITLGIYAPRHTKVWCMKGES